MFFKPSSIISIIQVATNQKNLIKDGGEDEDQNLQEIKIYETLVVIKMKKSPLIKGQHSALCFSLFNKHGR